MSTTSLLKCANNYTLGITNDDNLYWNSHKYLMYENLVPHVLLSGEWRLLAQPFLQGQANTPFLRLIFVGK